jgi:hypothetical protein
MPCAYSSTNRAGQPWARSRPSTRFGASSVRKLQRPKTSAFVGSCRGPREFRTRIRGSARWRAGTSRGVRAQSALAGPTANATSASEVIRIFNHLRFYRTNLCLKSGFLLYSLQPMNDVSQIGRPGISRSAALRARARMYTIAGLFFEPGGGGHKIFWARGVGRNPLKTLDSDKEIQGKRGVFLGLSLCWLGWAWLYLD